MIKKLGTDYLIQTKGTNGKTLEITAYISDEGITLYNKNDQNEFVFIDSDPKLVGKIGRMLVTASKL